MEFRDNLWAAAISGWWTVLISFAFLLVSWALYMLLGRKRIDLMVRMWGGPPGIDHVFVQRTVLISYGVMKLIMLLVTVVALWLTLWASTLG